MNVSLSAQNCVKRYGGVVALSDGNLEVHSGEVVALIGANGSGKSTLSKIITGVVALDRGQLLLDGAPVQFSSPQAAKKLGIASVYQELSLVPQMTVAENIWLAREPLNAAGLVKSGEMRARTQALLRLFKGTFRTSLSPDDPVDWLPPDEKQIVEILKAINLDPRVLILDEATASLDSRQVRRLFELIQDWKSQGTAIVFVSHRMDEIFRIADRFTVLRNGKTVGGGEISNVSEREIVRLMVGGALAPQQTGQAPESPAAAIVEAVAGARSSRSSQEVILQVENLETAVLRNISLSVCSGELVGLGGLQGQGQRDLLLAIYGDQPFKGNLSIHGEPAHFNHPRQAIKKEIALVPGDRSREGLLFIRSILENILLPSWRRYGFPLRMRQARRDAAEISKDLSLVMESLDSPVSSLSGGNAQKVVIGKWLMRKPKLLLLDDPTKGVDVGTKAEFYKLLEKLGEQGTAILFYSSDDEELLGLCDRVLVLHDGSIRAELAGETLTRERLVAAAMGSVSNSISESAGQDADLASAHNRESEEKRDE